MIFVVLKMHAVGRELIEICYRFVEDELRRVIGLALYQLFDYRNVPVVDVRVRNDMNKLARLKPDTCAIM